MKTTFTAADEAPPPAVTREAAIAARALVVNGELKLVTDEGHVIWTAVDMFGVVSGASLESHLSRSDVRLPRPGETLTITF